MIDRLRLDKRLSRATALLDDDGIVILDHQGMEDRVHKILYSRISAITVTKKIPSIRLFLVGSVVAFFGYFSVFQKDVDTSARIVMSIPLVVCGIIMLWYAISRITVVRVYRGSEFRDLPFMAMPHVVSAFMYKLTTRIDEVQKAEAERLEKLYSHEEQNQEKN